MTLGTPYAGGCACGAVRYHVPGDPVGQVHCQCRDCQRRSGTGHASFLAFLGRAGVTIEGAAREWAVEADSGREKRHAFCPDCGAPVYLTFPDMPDLFVIHAGSLDAPERFAPQIVTYGVRALGWDAMDPGLTVFERMPG